MSRAETGRRDLRMAVEALAGRSQNEIASTHGVCERTVRRGIARARDRAGASEHGGTIELIGRDLIQLEVAIGDLAEMRLGPLSPQDKLAVLGAQTSLMMNRAELLLSLGAL